MNMSSDDYESEFDFDFFEVTKEASPDDDFDFSLIYGPDEPVFDLDVLDTPVSDYEDDEGDPTGGVTVTPRPPYSDKGGGAAKKIKKKEKEPVLVGS